MISRETIIDFFERTRQLRKEGRVSWDIDDVCRWSYFFVDSSREKLVEAGRVLEQEGYEPIGFLEPAPEDEDQETLYLRVDRIEKHNVQSLFDLNERLYALAARLGLRDYDGMDSGAVDDP